MAAFNTMMMDMMTPPSIDYSEYETSGLNMEDTGGRIAGISGLGGRHEPVMVEPGETIISKTQNAASIGSQPITLNIQGDVYDGDNFAEKIGVALPDALRNADLGGSI
jgi:hypothetical protein